MIRHLALISCLTILILFLAPLSPCQHSPRELLPHPMDRRSLAPRPNDSSRKYPSVSGFTVISYPGSTYTVAYGLNNVGQIVGSAVQNGLQIGFIYDTTTATFTDITYPGSTFTIAQAINDAGMVVGWYGNSNGTFQGFTEQSGNYTSISYPGSINTALSGINNRGDMVGVFQFDTQYGFLYTGGIFIKFDPPGSLSTYVGGISDLREVVGAYSPSSLQNGPGFVFQNGVFTDINYPGATGTGVYSVNSKGNLAGGFGPGSEGQNDVGFVYNNHNTSFIALDPQNSIDSEATGINESNEIVGFFVVGSTDYGYYKLPNSTK